jgi:hypothetical protein
VGGLSIMLHQQNGVAINVRKLPRFASAKRKDFMGNTMYSRRQSHFHEFFFNKYFFFACNNLKRD